MPAVARVGDKHSGICNHGLPCCPHPVSGVITAGSDSVFANGMGVARVGDTVTCTCPHCGAGTIKTGSSKHFANGMAMARIGDEVLYGAGKGYIISGSPNVNLGAQAMSVAVMTGKSTSEISSMPLSEIMGL